MRKTLLAALVAASALVPAVAFAQDDHRSEDRSQWHQRGDSNEKGQRPQRQAQQQQQPQQAQPAPQPQQQRFDRQRFQPQAQVPTPAQSPNQYRGRGQWNGGNQRQDQSQGGGFDRSRGQQLPQANTVPSGQADAFRQYRRGGRPDAQNGQLGAYQQSQQFNRGQQRDRVADPRSYGQRDGGNRGGYQQHGYGDRGGNWNRDWRQDRRYDWGNYRAENRNLFRLPRYYAPNGWNYGYRRFSIGFRLAPLLFEQSYWIDDPYYYQLPPVYGPYRWVRYYNDALLVDIYSGEVVDTVYDIFW